GLAGPLRHPAPGARDAVRRPAERLRRAQAGRSGPDRVPQGRARRASGARLPVAVLIPLRSTRRNPVAAEQSTSSGTRHDWLSGPPKIAALALLGGLVAWGLWRSVPDTSRRSLDVGERVSITE